MRNNMKRPTRPEDLMHDAAVRGDHLPPGGAEAGRAGPSSRIQAGVFPHTDIHTVVTADTGVRAQSDDVGSSAYGEYANNVGPRLPAPAKPGYQGGGRDVGAGYLSNPFNETGRKRIGRQFWHAPLGGHARNALEGQEIFGHTITAGQARTAEQGLAGLAAVGVGVPAFMAAVNQLSTPQTPDTIPMV